jgi:hypothetical protein
MAGFFSSHRSWQDWLCVAAGIVVFVFPWIVEGSTSQTAVLNGVVIGLVIAAIGALELTALQRWEEWCQLLFGLWLIVSPWLLGFSHFSTLTTANVVLGAVVALIGAYELWQDWARSDQELAHRG